jgi:hypothetical protein
MVEQDKRCCGTGVCIINDQGQCWCGQTWDGNKMVAPQLKPLYDSSKTQTPTDNSSEVDKT